MPIDEISLNFSKGSLTVLNVCLGIIMFGVALDLKWVDFKRLIQIPKSALTGVVSQFLLLPLLTFLLVWVFRPHPSIALGMILVAACPGGNISNFISQLAKGNVALSISLTGIATVLAIFMTPFNFTLWGSILPETSAMLKEISISPWNMFKTIITLLGLPLLLGMLFSYRFPNFTNKIKKPVKIASIVFFTAFVVIAFANNYRQFLAHIHLVALIVFLHNGLGLLGGFGFAKAMRLPKADCRTISIETGIQNSALALILIFDFFGGKGGMALIAAWWGIWHIISGLTVAAFWSRK